MQKCLGITKDNKRCHHPVDEGTLYCYQHSMHAPSIQDTVRVYAEKIADSDSKYKAVMEHLLKSAKWYAKHEMNELAAANVFRVHVFLEQSNDII